MNYPKPTTTKKKRRKVKSERQKLVDKLDNEIRRICRERDPICGACGKHNTNTSQVSHFVDRRTYALRWDLRNCNLQHAMCNYNHRYNPNPYALWLVSRYGSEILVEFEDIRHKVKKTTTPQLRELLEELKAWDLPIA